MNPSRITGMLRTRAATIAPVMVALSLILAVVFGWLKTWRAQLSGVYAKSQASGPRQVTLRFIEELLDKLPKPDYIAAALSSCACAA